MDRACNIPFDDPEFAAVGRLKDFFDRDFKGDLTCVVLRRQLKGDFDGLAPKILAAYKESRGLQEGNRKGGDIGLFALRKLAGKMDLTPDQKTALSQICADMASCGHHGFQDVDLRLVDFGYHDVDFEVRDFHHDGDKQKEGYNERLACCYNESATEFIRNVDVLRVERRLFHDGRYAYKAYVPRPEAVVLRPGLGDLWRQVSVSRCNPNRALVHRAPAQEKDAPPRMMLVADLYSPV